MTIPLNSFPASRPYSNVQPFTVRAGATHMLQIETLLKWVRDELVPHIDNEVGGLADSWTTQTLELIENWETLSTSLVESVNEKAGEASADAATAELAKQAAEAARDLAEQFASDAAEVQDATVSGIFNDAESLLRSSLDTVYAPLSSVEGIVTAFNEGRLSEASLEGLFAEKVDKTVYDDEVAPVVSEVNEGRLSETGLAAEMVSRFGTLFNQSGAIKGSEGKTYQLIAGVLRNMGSPGFWVVLDDAGHAPVGVESVVTTDTAVEVNFTPAASLVWAGIQADETLGPQGYSAGISLGLTKATIRMSRDRIDDFISYEGGVFTSAKGNMVPEAPGMDASGRVFLRHDMIEGFGVSLESRSVHEAKLVTMTGQVAGTYQGRTTISWKNSAGNVVTTPDAACSAYVTRMGGGSVNPKGVAAGSSNANFWFMAIVEVAD